MSTPIYLQNQSTNPYFLEDAEALPVFGESLASVASVTSVNGRKGDVILKTSDLENNSGYITKDVEDLTNYTRTDELPTKLSQFENDEEFQTVEQVATSIGEHNESNEAHADIREDVSGLDNRLTTAEEDIDTLETTTSSQGTRLTTAEGNITTLQGTTSGLDTRLTTAEGTISSQGQRLTTAESDIDKIEEKIPNAATASNQLADKAFVNSSIATNTANFRGTYDSVEELETIQDPTNNDYAFVNVVDGENSRYDRYKYVALTSSWEYEYTLNNSSFTQAQWDAIDSGITSNNVTKLTNLAIINTIGTGLTLVSGTLTANTQVNAITSEDWSNLWQ